VRRPIVFVATSAVSLGLAAGAWWVATREPEPAPLAADWIADVHTLAGDGIPGGRDGRADHARFEEPFGIAAAKDGSIYVSVSGALHGVRIVGRDGEVRTLAGGPRGYADGDGTAARFDTPSGLAVAADGSVYIADTGNNAIRRVTPAGVVSTIAGDAAELNGPVGIALDASGRVIVADTYNDRIRAIAPDGTVTTIAGAATPGFVDGAAQDARFDTPTGVAVAADGTIVVADAANGAIRTIAADGRVETRTSAASGIALPLAVAAAGRDVFVADERGRIVALAADGTARVLAGGAAGFEDGRGSEARFRRPSGLAVLGPGQLVVSDTGNAIVRLLFARSHTPLRVPPSPRVHPQFDVEAFGRLPLLWPVMPMDEAHEIAGTIGEARGGEGTERFHAGIDVRIEEGTPVHAVRDGAVSSPVSTGDFGSLNEWLRIGPITYVHIRAGRERRGADDRPLDPTRFVTSVDESGRLARIRVKRGARFTTGEVIATVNRFNHVHLNVGWPGEEHNPLAFRLAAFEDTIPPTIARRGVQIFDEAGQPLTRRVRGRLIVSGRVEVVVDAWDQSDGNRPTRRLGVYALGYEVLHPDGRRAAGFESVGDSIRFDRLALDPGAARLVYAPGSGIPFYGSRVTRFRYTVTNQFHSGTAHEGVWDTSRLPPGDYILRVWAADIRGNKAVANRDLPITIEVAAADGAAAAR
jgi:sugar lactone lactonase YvrE